MTFRYVVRRGAPRSRPSRSPSRSAATGFGPRSLSLRLFPQPATERGKRVVWCVPVVSGVRLGAVQGTSRSPQPGRPFPVPGTDPRQSVQGPPRLSYVPRDGRLSRDPLDFRTFQWDGTAVCPGVPLGSRTFQGGGTAVCPGTPWTFIPSKAVERPSMQGPPGLSHVPRGRDGRLSRDSLDFACVEGMGRPSVQGLPGFRMCRGDGTAVCPCTPRTFARSKGMGRPHAQGKPGDSCVPNLERHGGVRLH